MATKEIKISPEFIVAKFPKYIHPSQCSTDLHAVLEKFNNLLLFKRECVVDGHLYDMINLEGTLPITYKGEKYNIPLRVMLPEDYPFGAPIIYMQPTEGMRMARNIDYVNDRGKVSIVYLDKWKTQKHPDLCKLLYRLIILFSENPPVWTKITGSIVKVYEEKSKRTNRPVREHEKIHNYEVIDPLPKPPKTKDDASYDSPNNRKVDNPNESLPTPGQRIPSSEIHSPIEENAEVLKTYSEIKLIGSGGFAKVYLYEKKTTKHKVACKIVDFGVNDANIQEHAKALRREIQLLDSLNNPFIVKYITVEEYNNKLAMVMEYFPKGSLYQVLQEMPDRCFSEDKTRVYTWQILQGLKYLHENKIVHKDIKARNILVHEQDTIRIADFGISKKIVDLVTTTGTNSKNFGTIYWQSPESLCPETKCCTKTDVWSLGCTVVEMLMGKPPLSCDGVEPLQATLKISKYEVYPPKNFSDVAKEFLGMCFRPANERPTSKEIMANSEFPKYSLE